MEMAKLKSASSKKSLMKDSLNIVIVLFLREKKQQPPM